MKKILIAVAFLAMILLSACKGAEGRVSKSGFGCTYTATTSDRVKFNPADDRQVPPLTWSSWNSVPGTVYNIVPGSDGVAQINVIPFGGTYVRVINPEIGAGWINVDMGTVTCTQ